jgi:hypothetical protein
VGEVVDAEGRLETIRRLGWSRDDLDARVADDPGQRRQVGPAERFNEGVDRTESIEIERQQSLRGFAERTGLSKSAVGKKLNGMKK